MIKMNPGLLTPDYMFGRFWEPDVTGLGKVQESSKQSVEKGVSGELIQASPVRSGA